MGASKSFHTDTGRTSDPGKATIRTHHKRTPESDIQRCPFSYGYRTQPEAFSNYQRQTAPAARYHIESENIVTFSDKINGNLKKAYTVIKKDRATFTHIDVHFGRGGDTSAAKLESAATNKRKEYREAHESFMGIVRELQERPEPTTPRAAMLCEIERLERSISAKPNVVTFGVNYDGVFTREAQSFMHRLAKIKYPAVEGCQNYLVTRSNWIDHWVKAIQSGFSKYVGKRDGTVVY